MGDKPATRLGLRLGAHLSIAGGLPCAVDRADQLRATALQVFVKSARQWEARPLAAGEAARFRGRLEQSGLTRHTLAHATYLINLASPERAVRSRSIRTLALELERCDRIGIPYLVLHPGAHRGSGEATGLRRIVGALDRLLAPLGRGRSFGAVTLLLELTAGQGTQLGHRFEHLTRILERARCQDRLGVCFDTCHALAAGYDLRGPDAYGATFAELDRQFGLERVRAFHLNDSKTGLGSRRDRHEHIGRGRLGREAFRLIVNDPRFRDLPMVLETPKGPTLAEDRRNLSVLRGLVARRRRTRR